MRAKRQEGSGILRLDGDFVCYDSPSVPIWRVAVDQIRLIGEWTTDQGPFVDDYFLGFATDATGWRSASFYAEGRDKFVAALSARLGSDIVLSLANSVDYTSRILWPPHLVGLPMFDFEDHPRKGVLGRVADYFLPRNMQTFSKAALRELNGGDAEATA